jgi:Ca2+-binding EF-hand superfamily protein
MDIKKQSRGGPLPSYLKIIPICFSLLFVHMIITTTFCVMYFEPKLQKKAFVRADKNADGIIDLDEWFDVYEKSGVSGEMAVNNLGAPNHYQITLLSRREEIDSLLMDKVMSELNKNSNEIRAVLREMALFCADKNRDGVVALGEAKEVYGLLMSRLLIKPLSIDVPDGQRHAVDEISSQFQYLDKHFTVSALIRFCFWPPSSLRYTVAAQYLAAAD